ASKLSWLERCPCRAWRRLSDNAPSLPFLPLIDARGIPSFHRPRILSYHNPPRCGRRETARGRRAGPVAYVSSYDPPLLINSCFTSNGCYSILADRDPHGQVVIAHA